MLGVRPEIVTAESQFVVVAVTFAVACGFAKFASVEYSRQTDAELAPLPKPTTRGVAVIVFRPDSPSWMPTTKTLPARGSRTTDQPS